MNKKRRIRRPVFDPGMNQEARKKRVETILNKLHVNDGAVNPHFDDAQAYRRKMMLSINIIFWVTILGSSVLLGSSIFYKTIPSPTTFVTTQNGNLYPIKPVRVISP